MNRFVLSGLTFAMALSTAQAEPLTLSAEQMDQVTASGNGREWLSNNQVTRNAVLPSLRTVPAATNRQNREATSRKTLDILDSFGSGG
jgi:hypothetical protein